jgi:hypothetical protein
MMIFIFDIPLLLPMCFERSNTGGEGGKGKLVTKHRGRGGRSGSTEDEGHECGEVNL